MARPRDNMDGLSILLSVELLGRAVQNLLIHKLASNTVRSRVACYVRGYKNMVTPDFI